MHAREQKKTVLSGTALCLRACRARVGCTQLRTTSYTYIMLCFLQVGRAASKYAAHDTGVLTTASNPALFLPVVPRGKEGLYLYTGKNSKIAPTCRIVHKDSNRALLHIRSVNTAILCLIITFCAHCQNRGCVAKKRIYWYCSARAKKCFQVNVEKTAVNVKRRKQGRAHLRYYTTYSGGYKCLELHTAQRGFPYNRLRGRDTAVHKS